MTKNEVDENGGYNFSLIKYLSLQKRLLAAKNNNEKQQQKFSKRVCKQDTNKNNRSRTFQQYQSEVLEYHKE